MKCQVFSALRLPCVLAWVLFLLGSGAAAQQVGITLPPTSILPNYDRLPIGQTEALEAGAYLARAEGASAAWYNPAGMALAEKSGFNASAVAYEWNSVSVEGVGTSTTRSRFSSVSTLVAAVIGQPIIHSERWRLGFALGKPVSWQPGRSDGAFTLPTSRGDARFSYSSDVSFSTLVPAFAAAYAPRKGLRFGTSVGIGWTGLDQVQDVTARTVSADSVISLRRSFQSDGQSAAALFTLGAQWDFASGWTTAAMITSPGLRLWGSSLVLYDASVIRRDRSGDLYFRDPDARFEYRLPMGVGFGVARRFQSWAIEANLRYHQSTDDYALFSSPVAAQVVEVNGGGPPTQSQLPFRDVRHQARNIWNTALGGHVDLNQHWTIHLGVFSDKSPVADPPTSMFRKANLYGGTGGVTLRSTHLSGALGLGYTFGTAPNLLLASLPDGTSLGTELKVRNLSLNYAIAYEF